MKPQLCMCCLCVDIVVVSVAKSGDPGSIPG